MAMGRVDEDGMALLGRMQQARGYSREPVFTLARRRENRQLSRLPRSLIGEQGPLHEMRASTVWKHSLVVTTAMATAMTTLKSSAVFTVEIVACVAHMASSIPRFVRMEVVERVLSAIRQRASVAVMGIKAVIDVAVEAVRTMEPGASSEEHPAGKPIRSVVAIGSAGIWLVVEVPVWAHRRSSNVYGNLSRCRGEAAHECAEDSSGTNRLQSRHNLLLDPQIIRIKKTASCVLGGSALGAEASPECLFGVDLGLLILSRCKPHECKFLAAGRRRKQ